MPHRDAVRNPQHSAVRKQSSRGLPSTDTAARATDAPLQIRSPRATVSLRARRRAESLPGGPSSTAVGAPLAGVDLLPAQDGRLLALEVNAVPGWKALSSTLELDVAALVLDSIAGLVARGKSPSKLCVTNR